MSEPTRKRLCDSCGGWDDGPRHQFFVDVGANLPTAEFAQQVLASTPAEDVQAVLTELADTSTRMKHPACCAKDGCPTGTCQEA